MESGAGVEASMVAQARALLQTQTSKPEGADDVKPLAVLDLSDTDLVTLLGICIDLREQLRTKRALNDDSALCVGITAPAGSGKSTIVHVLKLFLSRILKCGFVQEISQDDFLSSLDERQSMGIKSRWDINSTNEYYASSVVRALKHSDHESDVTVPFFVKSQDNRHPTISKQVKGKVDVLLFEGWRVGCRHPNFHAFNKYVDTMLYLKVDFDLILKFKYEAVVRGIESDPEHYDMYEQFGGYEEVFRVHYRGNYENLIAPVEAWSDVVLTKDDNHHFTKVTRTPGRWKEFLASFQVEETVAVVVGASQAGLSAGYYLQKDNIPNIVLEKATECGTSWRDHRWDSFRLVTENSLCNLPDFPCTAIGADPRGFMPRDQVVEYIQRFQKEKNVSVRFGCGAEKITKGWNSWVVETTNGTFIKAQAVIVASGGFHGGKKPPFAKNVPSHITQIHSWQYKNPQQLPEGAVLTVGLGQSGTQITAELAEAGRQVYCSVGSRSLRVPRRIRGLDFNWWLDRLGLYDKSYEDLDEHEKHQKRYGPNPSQAPMRDIRMRELATKYDLTLLGRASDVKDGKLLVDGASLHTNMERIEANVGKMRSIVQSYIEENPDELAELESLGLTDMEVEPPVSIPDCEINPLSELDLQAANIKSIVYCSGLSLDFSKLIPNLAGAFHPVSGYPEQTDGLSNNHPGLYFLGLHWMSKWKSAILLGCADDALNVTAHIASRASRMKARHKWRVATATITAGHRLGNLLRHSAHDGNSPAPMDVVPKNDGLSAAQPNCQQMTSDEAAALEFTCWLDQMPRSDQNVIFSTKPHELPLSYAQLYEFITANLGPRMAELGLSRKDRVCVVLPNGPAAAVAFLGMCLFCTYAPLNPGLKESEFEFEYEDMPAKAVVVYEGATDSTAAQVARRLGLPIIELVLKGHDATPAVDGGGTAMDIEDSATITGLFDLRWVENPLEPLASAQGLPNARDEIALVLHTSGTTKKPKIVPLTHGQITCGALCIKSTLQLAHTDVCINIMPLFHIHGISVNILTTILSGAAVVCTPGLIDPAEFYHSLSKDAPHPQPTWYSAVPTMHDKILQYGESLVASRGGLEGALTSQDHTLTMIRNCSAALLPPVSERMRKLFNCTVLPTYAMTESMPICSPARLGSSYPNTDINLAGVGMPAGPRVKILRSPEPDSAGNRDLTECETGEQGHICVSGTCVTSGYEYRPHMDEDPNIKGFADGWLITGDKGYKDQHGNVFLVGRFKEIINRSGEKLSPFTVEEVLLKHPSIKTVICFAMPHLELQEVVGAAVVLNPGRITSLEELRSFAKNEGSLRLEFLPESVVFMSEIPKGPTGKPARIGLAKRLGLKPIGIYDANPRVFEVGETKLSADKNDTITAKPKFLASTTKQKHGITTVTGPPVRSYDEADSIFRRMEKEHMHSGTTTTSKSIPPLSLAGLKRTLVNHLMHALASEVASILKLGVGDIELGAPLTSLGVESLLAFPLKSKIRKNLDVNVEIGTILSSSIAQLAEIVAPSVGFGAFGGDGSGGITSTTSATSQQISNEDGAESGQEEAENNKQYDQDEYAPFPLLPMQKIYAIGRLLTQEGSSNAWISWVSEITSFDQPKFEWAMTTLVRRHPMLRAVILGDGSRQRILPPDDKRWTLEVESPETAAEFKEAQEQVLSQVHEFGSGGLASSHLFDVFAVSKQNVGAPGTVQLTFVFDLLIADAASLSIISEELSALYHSDGNAEVLSPVSATYRNFALSKERSLLSEAKLVKEEKAYWARKCSLEPDEGGLPVAPQLPLRREKAGVFKVTRLSSSIAAGDWAKVLRRCQKEGITANSLLFTAFVRVLATWSSTKHFLMNMAFFNRSGVFPDPADEGRVVGNCASTILVDCDLRHPAGGPALTLVELATRLQASIYESVEHSTYTAGVDVMQDLNQRDKSPGRAVAPFVFASVLGLERRGGSKQNPFNWFGKTPLRSSLTTPNVWIDQQVFDDVDGSVWYNWDVEPERFPDGLVGDLFKTYQTLIRQIVVDADKHESVWTTAIDAHNLVPDGHQALIRKFNKSEERPDLLAVLQPLHRPLFDTSLSTSTATAVVDGATGAEVTFSSLTESAAMYAGQLEALVPNQYSPVPILLHKGAEQVVAVMAALLSGRSYVPLNVSWPEERILQIISILDARVVLTTEKAAGPYEKGQVWQRVQRIDVDLGLEQKRRKRMKSSDPKKGPAETMHDVMQRLKGMNQASPEELMRTAYIIFTSGSTGVPKGVTIRHEGASNTCIDCVERYGITASDRVLSLASLSFDLSVFDLFGILSQAGGSVVMPDPAQEKMPEHWLDLMERHQVTLWNTAPPVMSMLLEYVLHTPGMIDRFRKLKLRVVMLSGDFISLAIPRHLHAMLPDCEVISMGGATEASIWSCWHRISRLREYQGSIPYGRALANQSLHVLSREGLQPVPMLVEGEIVIGGVGLAAGYHNDKAKTNAAFVWSDHLRQIVYRTGDLGRVHPNGEVEIMGRVDFQLKINGYRIEIGDVEAALRAADGVDEACVVPVGDGAKKRLIGFLKCKHALDAATIASSALASCKSRLPAYSQPSRLHLLAPQLPNTAAGDPEASEAAEPALESGREGWWPLSANGKVDRKVLKQFHENFADGGATNPALTGGEGSHEAEGQEPRTATETEICDIWGTVLSTPVNNVFANWFDLGGDSLKMIGAMSLLNAKFGSKLGGAIKSSTLMEHQTVSSLAAHIDGVDPTAPQGPSDSSTPHIIGMQKKGSLPPLFFVAPVSGTISCYYHLSKLLPDQPFYALQHPGLEEGEEVFTTVEEMAASFVTSIKKLLATLPGGIDGNFSLGGWSMGGVIACEVALQLLEQGVAVRSVVLVDSPAPSGETIDMSNLSTTAELALSYANDITAYRIENLLPTIDELMGLSDDEVEVAVLESLRHNEPALVTMTRERFGRALQVYAANTRALAAYTPSRTSALFQSQSANPRLTLYLLRAETTNPHLSRYPGASSIGFGWRELGIPKSRLRIYAIRGDHYGLLPEIVNDSNSGGGGGANSDATSVQIARTLERILPVAARRKQPRFKTTSVQTMRHSMNTVERATRSRVNYSSRSAAEPSHLAESLHKDKFGIESASSSLLAAAVSSMDAMHTDGEQLKDDARVRLATADAYSSLIRKLMAVPHFVCVAAAAGVNMNAMLDAIDGVVPEHTQVHVVSSCKGSLSSDGLHEISMMGICDARGAYSTHYAPIDMSSASQWSEKFEAGRAAGSAAAKAAWAKSGRKLEFPDLCMVNSTTGVEEGVLAGIADVLGNVPCFGGSAADDGTLDGGGWVGALSNESPNGSGSFVAKSTDDNGDGVVVTLMWPSVETRMIFSSCYTGVDSLKGTITKAEGRVIHEIDGKAAADVYGQWVGEALPEYQNALRNFHENKPTAPVHILGVTSLRPIGRVPTQGDATSLIHPECIMPDGGLALFAAVEEGEKIMMMEATIDDLVDQMSEATKEEYDDGIVSFMPQLKGALAIYCGGCSLTVGHDRLESVGTNISAALSRKPFLTCFTYGEVGTVGDTEIDAPANPNCHGNLMYSMLLFGAGKDSRDPHGTRRLSHGGWTANSESSSSHEYGAPLSLGYGVSRSVSIDHDDSHSYTSGSSDI